MPRSSSRLTEPKGCPYLGSRPLRLPVTPILCGGTRRVVQEREQWASGCNFVAMRPGLVVVWFEGEEASAAQMAERLVYTLEVWVAAITGEAWPDVGGGGDLLMRHERASRAFARLARRIRDRGAWDDAFVDALCEPPQAFTYGGVISHVLAYGAVRREALAGVLRELGAPVPSSGDPIEWEASR